MASNPLFEGLWPIPKFLVSALGVRCTLRKQRNRFDSGEGLVQAGLSSINSV